MGYEPKRAVRKPDRCEVWIGISLDEAARMRPAFSPWQDNRWPLIEQRMSRWDCKIWLTRNGYPIPPKSSCIGCPFHTNAIWRDMKVNRPEEWQQAVEVDRAAEALFRLLPLTVPCVRHRKCFVSFRQQRIQLDCLL